MDKNGQFPALLDLRIAKNAIFTQKYLIRYTFRWFFRNTWIKTILLLKAILSYSCSKFRKSYTPLAAEIRVNGVHCAVHTQINNDIEVNPVKASVTLHCYNLREGVFRCVELFCQGYFYNWIFNFKHRGVYFTMYILHGNLNCDCITYCTRNSNLSPLYNSLLLSWFPEGLSMSVKIDVALL